MILLVENLTYFNRIIMSVEKMCQIRRVWFTTNFTARGIDRKKLIIIDTKNKRRYGNFE